VADLAIIFRASKEIRGLGRLASRYGVHVDGGIAAGFIKAAFADSEVKGDEGLAIAWQKVVDVLNVDLYKEWEDDIKVAIDNVKNRVKYTRLDPHGPKLGDISNEYDSSNFSLFNFSFADFLIKGTPSLNLTSPVLHLLLMQIHSFIPSQITDGSGVPIHCKILHFFLRRPIFVAKLLCGVTVSSFGMA